MATILNRDDEEENGQSTTGQSSIIGGGEMTPQSNAQGSGWTNLQQYLKANEGQGAAIAGAVTEDTSNQIKKSNDDTAAWKKAATGEVDEATRKDPYSKTFKSGTNQQVAGVDKGAFDAWKNLSNYWGAGNATDTKGYGDVYKQTQNTKDKITGLQDYDTQKSTLQDVYGKQGNYTRGQSVLDAFIMRGDQSGKQALQDFQDQNKDFGSGFETARGDVNKYIQGAEGRGQANYDAVMNALGTRQSGLNKTLADRAATAGQSQYNNAYDKVSNALIDGGAASKDFAIDTSPYIKKNQVSNAAFGDKAELDALNALAGFDNDPRTGGYQAGPMDIWSIDWDAINRAIADAKGETEIDPINVALNPVSFGLKG